MEKHLQTAYRILSATGEATDAEKLVPIHWAHVSGVNYNTIGDAGEEFLATISKDAKFRVRTTVNPMGYDKDSVEKFGLDENFIQKQESIRESYKKMGVTPSFSCIPYEIYDMPQRGNSGRLCGNQRSNLCKLGWKAKDKQGKRIFCSGKRNYW